MRCPQCQHENPLRAKFCEECAAPLAPACDKCGSQVSPAAKFCAQCGHPLKPVADNARFASPKSYTPQNLSDKILTSRVALEGERKQVTVLFADIKGSTELLAERDAEAAQKLILEPVLERMIDAVHRYEGTVHRVMGDGIMALFGAPLALEDHAVRGCYAALRMQETVARYADEVWRSERVAVTIRVGINSGEIIVRAIGDDLHMDYIVVGQTANLANRMEQMAKPGSVLTTADTFQLAEGYVVMKPLGALPVKGLADLVPLYEVTGAGAGQTRFQAAVRRGLTPFVGRDIELEQLFRAQRLAGQGRGQVVAIVGEAGVGKSRLLSEFLHSHRAADSLILEASSASYGQAMPYLPAIELLRRYFDVNIHDSTRSIREKVSRRILALDPSLQGAIPPLLDLLDALDGEHPFRSFDPLRHRQYTYQAVTRLLLRESRAHPVVAVVEDLHWVDPLTLGLLNELVVGAQNARLLLVVSYRPEYQDEWRNRPNFRQLLLDPLPSDSLAELLDALLGSDPSLLALKGSLVERAGGNPFFIEEIVRALVGADVLEGTRGSYRLARPFSSVEVPPTVRAVLAARIDALPSAEKRLLEEAAVIGHDAPFALLQAIGGLPEQTLGGLLDNLQAAEFLYATQLFPDLQYTFKHALTHDVAYSGVLHERRRELHARVVDAIERLYGDRPGEQVDRLAHHAVRGEMREKAVNCLQQAGVKAAARSALSEARAWFDQALSILDALPQTQAALEQAFEIHLELRPVLRQLDESRKMLEHLCKAEVIAERLQDDRRLGRACAFMTTARSTLGELDEALVTGSGALEIARRLGDLRLRIIAASVLEQAHYYRGEYEQVLESAPETLAAMPADWVHEYLGMALPASVFIRAQLIMSLAELGRFAEAAKYEAEASRLAEASEHAFTIGWAHFAASMLHLLKGDWKGAVLRVERWIAIVRTGNVAIHLPWAVASSAWALAQIGEASEALNRLREGEQLLERQAATGIVAFRGWAYGAAGRACLLLGRSDEARRLGDRAVESSRHHAGFTAHALRLLGDIASQPDRFDAGEAAARYGEALALAHRHGMRPLIAHCHLGLGKAYQRSGKPEPARENLTAARSMYREMDMGFWLEQGEAGMTNGGHWEPRIRRASKSSNSGIGDSP